MNITEPPATEQSGSHRLSGHSHEAERIHLLAHTRLLDTPPSESFDQITRLASQMFRVPIALVTLVDSDRQWFKSRFGLDVAETEREFSFCSHAIERHEVMVVEDAARDPRFADNPLVTGHPHIRFYAGAPLVLASGHALGSLCVIDHQPRSFGQVERAQLETLATFVMSQIELHRRAGRVNEITRLPNRTQMAEDIEGKMLLDPGASRGMLLIDVIGHQRLQEAARAVGIEPLEATLRDIASRLRCMLGIDWPLYHVSETRFCVKMRGDTRREREDFCRMVLERVEEAFDSGGISVQLEVVAGLVEFDLTVHSGTDALRKATSAMHEAGSRGEKFRWHDEALDAAHGRAYQLMRDVAVGLARGEFRLVYQPKFNLAAAAYSGVEALARWRHPVYGDVSPGEFIPLIEKTALIHEFTRWALDAALAQTSSWQSAGTELTVAVNVSSRNLDAPGFVESVRRICSAHRVDAKWLHIECTENAVMTSDETRATLIELQSLGAQISLDDFGMGYSNFSCLRGLPVQLLKLDQSLIKPMESEPAAHALVESLILLGHSLGFRMLAEGVETELACNMLIAAGCDALQGYYLARPMEAAQVSGFLARPPFVPNARSSTG